MTFLQMSHIGRQAALELNLQSSTHQLQSRINVKSTAQTSTSYVCLHLPDTSQQVASPQGASRGPPAWAGAPRRRSPHLVCRHPQHAGLALQVFVDCIMGASHHAHIACDHLVTVRRVFYVPAGIVDLPAHVEPVVVVILHAYMHLVS